MAANEIHVGDISTLFVFTIQDDTTVVDVSSATSTKNLLFVKPSGGTLTGGASFSTDGTNGQIEYASVSGDLAEVGAWEVRASIVITGWTGKTDIKTFTVHR